MLRSLCLILFLCCVLVAGAFPARAAHRRTPCPIWNRSPSGARPRWPPCLDGDTMQLTNRSRVRLAGIDTPELKPRKGKPQFYAREARELLTRLARGQEVRFFAVDKEGKDKYGRIVADVRLKDGRSLNGIMVREGAAFFYPHKGLDKRVPGLAAGPAGRSHQGTARHVGRGALPPRSPEELHRQPQFPALLPLPTALTPRR